MLDEFRKQTSYKIFAVLGYLQLLLSLAYPVVNFIDYNASGPLAAIIVFLGTPIILLGYLVFACQLMFLGINFFKFITSENNQEEAENHGFDYFDMGFFLSVVSLITVLVLSLQKSGFSPLIIFID